MAVPRGFLRSFYSWGAERTTQEWIRLQVLPRSLRVSPNVPVSNAGPQNPKRGTLGVRLSRSLVVLGSLFKSIHRKWNERFPGWRGGVIAFSILASLVLFINLSALIWAVTKLNEKPFATIRTGSRKSIELWSSWFHLFINIFSTLLLSGSNYCMQCLSSPTREEIDKAHAKHTYLNVGILSMRNMLFIRKRRLCLVVLLIVSGIPLHFTYEDQLEALQGLVVDGQFRNASRWENTTTTECKKLFIGTWQSDHGSIIIITKEAEQAMGRNDTVLWYDDFDVSNGVIWKFGATEDWKVPGHPISPISYCSSLKTPHRSRLQIHIWLLLTIVIFNAIKIFCMLASLWEQRNTPLTTLGDAISSFLDSPDPNSLGMCLLSEEDVKKTLKERKEEEEEQAGSRAKYPTVWQKNCFRYHKSISSLRWLVYLTASALALVITLYYFREITKKYRGDRIFKTDIQSLWRMGFGRLYEQSTGWTLAPWCFMSRLGGDNLYSKWYNCVRTPHMLYHMVLGSLPQVVVSILYLALNYHLTSMLQLRNWTSLVALRQPLRVSNPVPGCEQRSTYWLSLPYKYSIPQLISSITLSWLVSHTIFFYRFKEYDDSGQAKLSFDEMTGQPISDTFYMSNNYWFGIGYSGIGALCSFVFGAIVLSVSVVLAFQKCQPGLPLGANNSFVIAAACHPPENDRNAARKLVQWGEASVRTDNTSPIRHCTITSFKVEPPVAGQMYA